MSLRQILDEGADRNPNVTEDGRRYYYVGGEPVELWEDPSHPFGWGQEDLQAYAAGGRWVTLFNSLVLASLLEEEED